MDTTSTQEKPKEPESWTWKSKVLNTQEIQLIVNTLQPAAMD